MAVLVADCPRCGSVKITFDLLTSHTLYEKYGWQRWYEVFAVCRHCQRSTIFVLSEQVDSDYNYFHDVGFSGIDCAVNKYTDVEGYVSLKDAATIQPPQHLPNKIEKVFKEGAVCKSVNCFNAAGTMFRLCIDLATRAMLPEKNENGLNDGIRRSLGLRLAWLFDNKKLPDSLRELATSVKNDGDDGAHQGDLKKEDVEDLIDFTYELLERIYTEPERLRLAEERRRKRREESSDSDIAQK